MATQTSLIVQQTRIQEWAEYMIKNYVLIESNLHYKNTFTFYEHIT